MTDNPVEPVNLRLDDVYQPHEHEELLKLVRLRRLAREVAGAPLQPPNLSFSPR